MLGWGIWKQDKLNCCKLTVFTEIWSLVLNKCSLDCYEPLVHFQISKKVDFGKFYQCSHCFYEGEAFQMSLLSHFHWCHPCTIISLLYYHYFLITVIFTVLLSPCSSPHLEIETCVLLSQYFDILDILPGPRAWLLSWKFWIGFTVF